MSIQEYYRPTSLEEASALLSGEAKDSLIIAGGTLAMPLINDGISMPEQVLGLRSAGMDYIKEENGFLLIGSTATMTMLAEQTAIPMLADAALAVGGWAIRNMATVGGNFFAPPPGGDFATALLALDAELSLVGGNGTRSVPISEFYTGFLTNILQPGELIHEIRLQVPEGKTAFEKYGRRHANTPSVVTAALSITTDKGNISHARIALNAVGAHPVRAEKAEQYLLGKTINDEVIAATGEIAADECSPFTDAIASEWYRRKMVPVVLARALQSVSV